MPALRKYPPELRKRAMRLVHEAREEDPGLSMHQVVQRIGCRVGVNVDTLRGWVHWFNANRLHSSLDYVAPIEYETEYYRQINSRQQPLPGAPALH